ncbi:MAG: fused MFS/spermidine synthase [Eubacterium sp.]|nr:fused MFS/spermidine synthase [Eubacterium sp.]
MFGKGKNKEVFPRAGRVIFMKKDPGYGRIEVRECIENNALIRLLLVDDVRESAANMEEGRHYDLVFKYTKDFTIALERRPDIRNVLLLGGAGFSFPKYFISSVPEGHIDVVECNPLMFELAMKYFYLDELYREFDLNETRRMDVFLEDANDYLRRTDRTYDLIINDAYVSNRMDSDLLKDRQVRRIRECLNPGGVYMINLITAIRGAEATPGILEYEILNKHFRNTDMFACKSEMGALERQNMILVGTDGTWK